MSCALQGESAWECRWSKVRACAWLALNAEHTGKLSVKCIQSEKVHRDAGILPIKSMTERMRDIIIITLSRQLLQRVFPLPIELTALMCFLSHTFIHFFFFSCRNRDLRTTKDNCSFSLFKWNLILPMWHLCCPTEQFTSHIHSEDEGRKL